MLTRAVTPIKYRVLVPPSTLCDAKDKEPGADTRPGTASPSGVGRTKGAGESLPLDAVKWLPFSYFLLAEIRLPSILPMSTRNHWTRNAYTQLRSNL